MGGTDRAAGFRGEDTGRNILAYIQQQGDRAGIHSVGGALFHDNGEYTNIAAASRNEGLIPYHFTFDACRVWGTNHTAAEFAPVHAVQSVAVYIGTHA